MEQAGCFMSKRNLVHGFALVHAEMNELAYKNSASVQRENRAYFEVDATSRGKKTQTMEATDLPAKAAAPASWTFWLLPRKM